MLKGVLEMSKHIKTISAQKLQKTLKTGGCGECQTSCQSACKTSCTVGNQVCKHYSHPETCLWRGSFLFQMQLRSLEGCRGDLFYSQRLGQNMTIR